MKPWGDREMGTAAISCTKCSQVAGLIHTVGRNIPGRCGQVAGLIQRSVKVLQRHRLFVQLPFIQNLICHMLLMRNAHLIYCAVLHDYCTVKSMYVRRTSFSETAKLAKTGTWRYVCMDACTKKSIKTSQNKLQCLNFLGACLKTPPPPPCTIYITKNMGPTFTLLNVKITACRAQHKWTLIAKLIKVAWQSLGKG